MSIVAQSFCGQLEAARPCRPNPGGLFFFIFNDVSTCVSRTDTYDPGGKKHVADLAAPFLAGVRGMTWATVLF